MSQVRVVTDSTADIPKQTADDLGILVVPLNVHFGDESYQDGVDLTADQFFEKLRASPQLPKTSAPSVEAFRHAYEQQLNDASGILCVTVSSTFSSTYNSAVKAAEGFPVPVRVVDSRSASMACGFAAMTAAEAGTRGSSLEEVEVLALDQLRRTGIVFYADTLEYLYRGGRIGRAKNLLGSLLQTKPLMTVQDGEVAPLSRVRTTGKAIAALVDWARALSSIERMAVIWSTDESSLEKLLGGLAPLFPRERIIVTKYGPTIGVHLGPGAMGIIAVEGPSGA